MNLPNKLTMARIILVIPFILCLELFDKSISKNIINSNGDIFETVINIFNNISLMDIFAALFFIAASLTDFLDGYIARKKNLITDFGKLMDPLSDKILVISALIIFVEKGYIWSWMVIVIIAREFLVTGIRIIAASKGEVIPADKIGKYKTATQMIAIILIIFTKKEMILNVNISNLAMIVPLILTIWSGYDYVQKSKRHFL